MLSRYTYTKSLNAIKFTAATKRWFALTSNVGALLMIEED